MKTNVTQPQLIKLNWIEAELGNYLSIAIARVTSIQTVNWICPSSRDLSKKINYLGPWGKSGGHFFIKSPLNSALQGSSLGQFRVNKDPGGSTEPWYGAAMIKKVFQNI